MKIELDREEIETLLNLLSPFSNPDSWDDEKLTHLENRIKHQLSRLFAFSMRYSSKIFFPGEWSIELLQQYILSNSDKPIFIFCENRGILPSIIQENLKVWAVFISANFLESNRNDRMTFSNGNTVIFADPEKELRGYNFDVIFL
jgi:hypothetical protein